MTKPITAVAVMMMEEEGKLRVTDSVSKFIPQFSRLKVTATSGGFSRNFPSVDVPTVAANREITIARLLTHTSSLSMGLDLEPKADETLASQMSRYSRLPLIFQPGTDWQ